MQIANSKTTLCNVKFVRTRILQLFGSRFSHKPASVLSMKGTSVENPTMYAYTYDSKYQLTAGIFGQPSFSTPGFSGSASFNEKNISYDQQGNMLSLQRTDEGGAITDDFTYNYEQNSNKLNSIKNGASLYNTYVYNSIGQMISESPGVMTRYPKYDVQGRILGIYTDPGLTNALFTYVYDEVGNRISNHDWTTNQTIYYARGLGSSGVAIYTQAGTGLPTQIEVGMGEEDRIGTYQRQANRYQYELLDQVGSVRAVVDQDKNVQNYNDFYPFGYVMRNGGQSYRYDYQGQFSEKNGETGWNAFDKRMYDARTGRWFSVDPENQFASPYMAMGNNPVSFFDPTGGEVGVVPVMAGKFLALSFQMYQ